MNKHLYREGKQIIKFPDDWEIIKIDEHPYYIRLSGYNMKSVDFMAVHDDWGLILIELKDYPLGAKVPNDLTAVLEKKYKDALSLIYSVNIYLNSKWYYRLFYKKLKWKWACPPEWDIWLKANNKMRSGAIVRLADISF